MLNYLAQIELTLILGLTVVAIFSFVVYLVSRLSDAYVRDVFKVALIAAVGAHLILILEAISPRFKLGELVDWTAFFGLVIAVAAGGILGFRDWFA